MIQIKQVLTDAKLEPTFVEFWSTKDSRNNIMKAIDFCEQYGRSIQELRDIVFLGKGGDKNDADRKEINTYIEGDRM